MKLNKKIRVFVAVLLLIAMTLSSIPITPVYAAENTNSKLEEIFADISTIAQSQAEATAEAIEDSISIPPKAGNWNDVKNDGLAWNEFHILVQNYIVSNNEGIHKELPLEITIKENDKEITKKGSADLYKREADGSISIWEVKPYSYSFGRKKEKGEEQLGRYIIAANGKKGGKQIENDHFYYYLTRFYGTEIEYITYTIYYEVQDNGLILYYFTRSSYRKRKDENENADGQAGQASETMKTPSGYEAVRDLYDVPLIEDDFQITASFIMDFIMLVNTWEAIHIAINAKGNTNNSGSAEIIYFCEKVKKDMMAAGLLYALDATGSIDMNKLDMAAMQNAIDEFMIAVEVFMGENFAAELIDALTTEDSDKINDIIKLLQGESIAYEEATEAQPPRDPLVIDLGTPGIQLHSLDNGVYFDLDNNGFAEKTAWIDVEDGFLALDRDGNGKIDNGGELFGDQVILKNGNKASSGFEALAELDSNQDGVIDQNDPIFSELKVWIDANHNGISEADELKTLNELGIVSISLDHEERSIIDDETGARIAETAYVTMNQNGVLVEVEISEFWFPINASDTTHGGSSTAGNVPDLVQAITDDENSSMTLYQFMVNDYTDNFILDFSDGSKAKIDRDNLIIYVYIPEETSNSSSVLIDN